MIELATKTRIADSRIGSHSADSPVMTTSGAGMIYARRLLCKRYFDPLSVNGSPLPCDSIPRDMGRNGEPTSIPPRPHVGIAPGSWTPVRSFVGRPRVND